MKDKHTPGPWRVSKNDSIYAKDEFIGIALSGKPWGRELPQEANARLMAASPEMKEELKECRKVLKHLIFYYENMLGDRIPILESRLVNIELLLSKIEGDESNT